MRMLTCNHQCFFIQFIGLFLQDKNTSTNYPPGRYDLCPAESLPEPVEVKSKLHDVHTIERDSLVQTKDAKDTKYSVMDPISKTHLVSS